MSAGYKGDGLAKDQQNLKQRFGICRISRLSAGPNSLRANRRDHVNLDELPGWSLLLKQAPHCIFELGHAVNQSLLAWVDPSHVKRRVYSGCWCACQKGTRVGCLSHCQRQASFPRQWEPLVPKNVAKLFRLSHVKRKAI